MSEIIMICKNHKHEAVLRKFMLILGEFDVNSEVHYYDNETFDDANKLLDQLPEYKYLNKKLEKIKEGKNEQEKKME